MTVQMWVNPPPADGRCECCGTHMSELKPFGGSGDPLVGDFTGALLVKKFRELIPQDCGIEESSISASWECRDCIVLSGEEYLEHIERRVREEEQESKDN